MIRVNQFKQGLRLPILAQLVAPLALLFATASTLGIWLAGMAAERAAFSQSRAQVGVAIETLRGGDYPLTEAVLRQVRGFTGFEIVAAEGAGPIVGTLQGPRHELAAALSVPSDVLPFSQLVHIDGVTYRAAIAKLPRRSARQDATIAVLAADDRLRGATLAAKSPPIAAFLAGQAIALALVICFARRLANRIALIRSKAANIALGEHPGFSASAPSDELGELAASMNDLADRLEAHRVNRRRHDRMKLLHQLAGGLAHRLRNAVAGARLALQLHQRDAGDDESEPVAVALEQLCVVEHHVQLLLHVNSEPASPGVVDLRQIAAGVVRLAKAKANHVGVRLTIRASPRPILVSADSTALELAIEVLVDNALEAAGADGSVDVQADFAQTGVALQAVVRVSDSGPGIATELIDGLFEPFVSGKTGGIGLGLFVARSIAASHGGTLTASRMVERTAFELRLPLATIDSLPTAGNLRQAAAAAPTLWSVPS